ncbi:MAG: hypothetical protein L6Q37_16150, partial [Bdellovibrionaceae bacterium]|nr:hypothetical protein [Pseudobdellovibrionaceae bacterium]
TRYDAFDFLETAQEAIDAVGFKNSSIESYSWNVSMSSDNEFQKKYIVDKIKEDILKTIAIIDQKENVIDVLLRHMSSSLLYDAITAGLSHTDTSLGLKEILRSNSDNLLQDLAKKIESLDVVNGINPKLLGLNKSEVSGKEILDLFKESIESRKLVARIFWAILVSSSEKPLKSNVTFAELTSRIILQTDNEIIDKLNSKFELERFSFLAEAKINNATINKIFKSSKDELRKVSNQTKQVEVNKFLIKLERSHPYDAFPRGSVGDCSTSNCFAIPLVPEEEFFWIRRPDGSVKGYFQFTRVLVNGKKALYLNTISGAGISKEDTRAIFHTIASSLKQLKVEKIVIPTFDKIPAIINFPEVEFVFQELAHKGKLVQVNYLDEESRLRLLPFSADSVDLPEKNKQAIEIEPATLILPKFKIANQHLRLNPEFPFPKASLNEIIMVALELRNRENNNHGISDILKANNIDPIVFEKLWRIVSNQDKKAIKDFHKATKDILNSLRLDYRWDDFIQSPLFFRGHMLAPDALIGSNKDLALSYIQVLIRAYSDIPLVYETLTPFYRELSESVEFIDLVKNLFKKNLKEFDRVLDYYELEHKSAYRTLAFLFQSGLPTEKFQNEIDVLSKQWELEVKDEERKNGVFVRRITLLGVISNFHPKYFDELIEFLEQITSKKSKFSNDDIRTVASYISGATTNDKLNKEQTVRMEKFLTSTEFGMSFLPHLGLFPIEKINVPKLVDALFKHEKYEWAAQLI